MTHNIINLGNFFKKIMRVMSLGIIKLMITQPIRFPIKSKTVSRNFKFRLSLIFTSKKKRKMEFLIWPLMR